MCFSFEVSLFTGLFSWSVGLFLLQKNLNTIERNKILFLLIFSSMQFVDAILWYIKMKKNIINYILSSLLIPGILSLQILFNVYYVNKNTNIILHVISILTILYMFKKFNGYSKGSCNKLSSPVWGSSEIDIYEMLLFLIIIGYPSNLFIIGNAILILIIQYSFKGGYGSLWCSVINILALYYLIKYYNK